MIIEQSETILCVGESLMSVRSLVFDGDLTLETVGQNQHTVQEWLSRWH